MALILAYILMYKPFKINQGVINVVKQIDYISPIKAFTYFEYHLV